MKITRVFFSGALACVMGIGSLQAQTVSEDSTGLPGDNFSLEGALEMFKKAGSPEEFEKLINSEDNKVNNLDLNEDGTIDYIKVIDKKDDDAHVFILQDAVSETENQDIAVIEVEKTGNDNAVLQIVGDEDIYGEQVIVEPAAEQSPTRVNTNTNVVVNVWTWPAVRYVYGPSYAVWVSPWNWRVRPVWWHPWRPVRWHVFHPYRAPYRHHYVVVHHHRVVHAHRIYTPVRTMSVTVHTRHQASVNHYRATRTTRSVTVSKDNKQVRATKKTTTVQGRKGRVKSTKTTTRARKKR
jgi:hypothetical protein